MSGLDALALDVNVTSKMEINDPITGVVIKDNEGKPAVIELLSMDSDIALKRRQAARKRIFEQVQKGKKIKYSVEQSEEDETANLVALTKGWYLVDFKTGNPLNLPFSEDNAHLLYSDPRFGWIKEQVQEFVVDRENFFES
jgi:hypothetical protein